MAAIDTTREFAPAEIVRMFEASCQIDYPTADEQNFRVALMKHIANRMGLRELKATTITGPGTGRQRPPLKTEH